jgi:hypothetical protein
MKRHRKLLLFPPLLLGLVLLGTWVLRRDFEAALVLADIAAGEGPSLLKRTTPEPERRTIRFSWQTREYLADLYRPGREALAGVLLMPGASEEGKDDPRLVAFATTLARARFNVLVPDLASLRSLQVNPGNIREVADTFSWLASRPELIPGGRGGVIAISYAVGPVILAAMEPDLRRHVRFIMAVGGYYDLPEVLTYTTTGWFRAGGRERYRKPDSYGKWIFVLSNADRLPDPSDREVLKAMARRMMRDPAEGVKDLEAKLSPAGRAVYAFVVNSDPALAPSLAARLPEAIEADIRALDLADKDLHLLKARLILIHGYDDDIIPYSQSIALAGAVSPGQTKLYLIHGLVHVDLKPGLPDRWRLWRAIDTLLAQREN